VAAHLGLGALLVVAIASGWWAFADARLTHSSNGCAAVRVHRARCGAAGASFARLDFKWLSRVEFITAVSTSLATLTMACTVWSMGAGARQRARERDPGRPLVSRGENVWRTFGCEASARTSTSARSTRRNLAWILVNQADVLVGSRMMSKAALGVYSVFSISRPCHAEDDERDQPVAFPAVGACKTIQSG